MFSPLNIIIKPSLIKRWLAFFIHLFVLISLYYVQLAAVWLLLFALIVLVSGWYEFKTKEPEYTLYWDLSERVVKIGVDNGALQSTLGISRLHLLFGIIYLQIKLANRRPIRLYIFKDSLDKQSYRKLRVAARWASLHEPKQN